MIFFTYVLRNNLLPNFFQSMIDLKDKIYVSFEVADCRSNISLRNVWRVLIFHLKTFMRYTQISFCFFPRLNAIPKRNDSIWFNWMHFSNFETDRSQFEVRFSRLISPIKYRNKDLESLMMNSDSEHVLWRWRTDAYMNSLSNLVTWRIL